MWTRLHIRKECTSYIITGDVLFIYGERFRSKIMRQKNKVTNFFKLVGKKSYCIILLLRVLSRIENVCFLLTRAQMHFLTKRVGFTSFNKNVTLS